MVKEHKGDKRNMKGKIEENKKAVDARYVEVSEKVDILLSSLENVENG